MIQDFKTADPLAPKKGSGTSSEVELFSPIVSPGVTLLATFSRNRKLGSGVFLSGNSRFHALLT